MLYEIVELLEKNKNEELIREDILNEFEKQFRMWRKYNSYNGKLLSERELNEEVKKRREESLIFVRELVKIGSPLITLLIKASTEWNGKEDYNVYMFPVTEIKHNPEFIKTLFAIQAIWGENVHLQRRRCEVPSVKNGVDVFTSAFRDDYLKESFTKFKEKYLKNDEMLFDDLEEAYDNDKRWESYIHISDFRMKWNYDDTLLYNNGCSGMATRIEVLPVIAY